MIVVLASRHDKVAADLVAHWPAAALCSAEDLTRRGWVWPAAANGNDATWVIGGEVVPDERVTGVFVRRSTVYAEELTRTHPDDRTYLASETQAFLAYVLSRTAARVVNPVDDGGAYGEAALRPERWMQAAAEVGVAAAPLRVRSAGRQHAPDLATSFEIVGEQVLGDSSLKVARAALEVSRCLGLCWAVASFDKRGRLSTITTSPAPSPQAAAALAGILTCKRRA